MDAAHRLSAAMLSFAVVAGSSAMAADCAQDKAIYRDNRKSFELRFQPVTEPAAATSHGFTVTLLDSKLVLDGVVLAGDDGQRANGLLMYQCPEGDVTGEDLRKCTVWDGVFYSVSADARIGDLPAAGAAAAPQLILSDFGRLAGISALWSTRNISAYVGDVLVLEGCAS